MHIVSGYINAGGRGTRLSSIFGGDPQFGVSKALLRLGEPPLALIEHQINFLAGAGLDRIVAGVGDHAHVRDYVDKAYPDVFGVRAAVAQQQLGNGGDLLQALREHPDMFGGYLVVTNVDTLVELDLVRVVAQHIRTGAGLTIVLTQNPGVPNENSFFVGPGGKVLYTHEAALGPVDLATAQRQAAYRASSTGFVVLDTEFLRALSWHPGDGPLSLYRDIMASALAQDRVYAYLNYKRLFVDVGTAATWTWAAQSPSPVQNHLCYTR